ncbi:MAG: hypothetical protein CMF50_02625 [Legionellales bacterium]|nr:hypothetical protein [Legionellales bacterium]|tara:strand:+ start:7032 stop:8849 length:1818 start_codon:yes stop_codon:yes gene_type:complete
MYVQTQQHILQSAQEILEKGNDPLTNLALLSTLLDTKETPEKSADSQAMGSIFTEDKNNNRKKLFSIYDGILPSSISDELINQYFMVEFRLAKIARNQTVYSLCIDDVNGAFDYCRFFYSNQYFPCFCDALTIIYQYIDDVEFSEFYSLATESIVKEPTGSCYLGFWSTQLSGTFLEHNNLELGNPDIYTSKLTKLFILLANTHFELSANNNENKKVSSEIFKCFQVLYKKLGLAILDVFNGLTCDINDKQNLFIDLTKFILEAIKDTRCATSSQPVFHCQSSDVETFIKIYLDLFSDCITASKKQAVELFTSADNLRTFDNNRQLLEVICILILPNKLDQGDELLCGIYSVFSYLLSESPFMLINNIIQFAKNEPFQIISGENKYLVEPANYQSPEQSLLRNFARAIKGIVNITGSNSRLPLLKKIQDVTTPKQAYQLLTLFGARTISAKTQLRDINNCPLTGYTKMLLESWIYHTSDTGKDIDEPLTLWSELMDLAKLNVTALLLVSSTFSSNLSKMSSDTDTIKKDFTIEPHSKEPVDNSDICGIQLSHWVYLQQIVSEKKNDINCLTLNIATYGKLFQCTVSELFANEHIHGYISINSLRC